MRVKTKHRTPAVAEQVDQSLSIEQIEGRQAVLEALKSKRPLANLFLLQSGEGANLVAIRALANDLGVKVRLCSREELDRKSQTRQHQGVIAIALPKRLSSIEEILLHAYERDEMPFIVVLDGLEDPQNVGAIVRTAYAAGCHGLIMRERRAAAISPAMIKAAAGTLEHLAVAVVSNITTSIKQLKEAGVWVVAADMKGKLAYQSDLNRAIALVIGSEGSGISHLVARSCDMAISLPMAENASSLNAAAATAALLFEIVRQKRHSDFYN
jgi:23S rRNA (guanosine2251-2'-O)-methyltransferase